MEIRTLFESDTRRWVAMGRDADKHASLVDTVEYAVGAPGDWILMDPGGIEIFPQVIDALCTFANVEDVRGFVCSHQDPDVMSSLPLWMGVCAQAKIYMPWLWTGFMAHFGPEYKDRFVAVPDEGMSIPVGRDPLALELIPAHYCHSSGNFSVYDSQAKILFSGDIGAALLPDDKVSLFVEDFAAHAEYMEGFHVRWMPSDTAKNDWIARVRKLDVQQICPQHGSIFRNEQVGQFLDWFERLNVGTGVRTQRIL